MDFRKFQNESIIICMLQSLPIMLLETSPKAHLLFSRNARELHFVRFVLCIRMDNRGGIILVIYGITGNFRGVALHYSRNARELHFVRFVLCMRIDNRGGINVLFLLCSRAFGIHKQDRHCRQTAKLNSPNFPPKYTVQSYMLAALEP